MGRGYNEVCHQAAERHFPTVAADAAAKQQHWAYVAALTRIVDVAAGSRSLWWVPLHCLRLAFCCQRSWMCTESEGKSTYMCHPCHRVRRPSCRLCPSSRTCRRSPTWCPQRACTSRPCRWCTPHQSMTASRARLHMKGGGGHTVGFSFWASGITEVLFGINGAPQCHPSLYCYLTCLRAHKQCGANARAG